MKKTKTDSFKFGLEKLASHLLPDWTVLHWKLPTKSFFPSIEQAADQLAEDNVMKVILITTMITPGGSHSEEVKAIHLKLSKIKFQYACAYDLDIFLNSIIRSHY